MVFRPFIFLGLTHCCAVEMPMDISQIAITGVCDKEKRGDLEEGKKCLPHRRLFAVL
jgi:hypothetical protein